MLQAAVGSLKSSFDSILERIIRTMPKSAIFTNCTKKSLRKNPAILASVGIVWDTVLSHEKLFFLNSDE
ncbi:MAG: hypothetical protein LBQ42_01230, partial [Synergistaceae bacterium]|nr:hypothetical protein [Synergistaceae bacterium]